MIPIPAIPAAWKVAGGAILVALLLAFGIGIYAKGRSDGSAACQAAVAKAVAAAQADDRERSAKLLAGQAAELAALHSQAMTSLQKVQNAPVTNTCGPSQRDASRGVQSIIRGDAPAP